VSALQWFLQWSGKEKFYDVLEKQGKVKEEHKKPKLSAGDELVLSVFFDLSNSRQMGMAVGHIPITVVWGAIERYKFPETVIEVIKQLDSKFVEYHAKSN
jgi:hypothetical protein